MQANELVGGSVCNVNISVFKFVVHPFKQLVLHLSKIGVSIWFSNDFKALVKSFVLCMPACRVNFLF